MSASKNHFALLDGMRGLAALVVITDHVPAEALMTLLPGRYLAVDFFFALSGFVLAHVYGERLANGWSVGRFMQVRLIRFYPLYIVATLAGALLALFYTLKAWGGAPILNDMASLAFGAAFLPTPPALSVHANDPFPFNGPAWSLFFELLINVVFALFILRFSRRVLVVILAISGAALTFTVFHFGRLDVGFSWDNFWGGFPRVTYAFFAGVLVYRLRETWRAPALPPLVAFVLLMAIFLMPAPGMLRPIWDLTAALVLFPALIALCANAEPRGATLRVSLTMGALSYGFYVLQVPVRDWTALLMELFSPVQLSGVPFVALVAALTAIAAAILHRVYDIPVRRFLSRHKTKIGAVADAQTN